MDSTDALLRRQAAMPDPGMPASPHRAFAANEPVERPRVLVACCGAIELNRRLLHTLRRGGFVASVVSSGLAAKQLEQEAWDVLLIDAQVDVDDALALLSRVRSTRSPSGLPILWLGTQAQWRVSAQAFEAGANDWIAYPVDPAEIKRRLLNLSELSRLHRLHTEEQGQYRKELSSRSARLDALVETGVMMSMERDRGTLLRQLLGEARRLLQCDGATMYMVTQEKTLRFELRTRDDPLPSMQIPLYDAATGRANENYVSVYTAVHNRSVLIDDVYAETRFDLSGTRAFDLGSGYRTISMLTVPIAPRGGEVIGVLQFMNALDERSGAVVPFDRQLVKLVEALAAQAAVALDNLNLVQSQKQLIESMIRVLATAIDAKSPYTGRHCERVPELATLLAEAACAEATGPLADFRFASEEEWQEFRIGAWLHDCGKITTPEYVIDKATKLETIHNRIHEVRTRFEVILRDLRIERLEARLRGEWDEACEARHRTALAQLTLDFEFVAKCNVGSESMDPTDLERLARIAATPWVRNFDDRLGLSSAERARLADEPPPALPHTEALLADRPSDIVPRPAEQQPDPSFGFAMDVPEHLYHRGELYNLSVRSGTLTREERYKINEHMVHTIMMLEAMPFPKHLSRVPEYAGTHHERIDGKGYPRRLAGPQLSVPSRIMAVADIFEALTASDRPYKTPKKLSEALRVLQRMAGEHIDAELYNLFLRSGVYLEFARRHLRPDQIDVADATPYLVTDSHA